MLFTKMGKNAGGTEVGFGSVKRQMSSGQPSGNVG